MYIQNHYSSRVRRVLLFLYRFKTIPSSRSFSDFSIFRLPLFSPFVRPEIKYSFSKTPLLSYTGLTYRIVVLLRRISKIGFCDVSRCFLTLRTSDSRFTERFFFRLPVPNVCILSESIYYGVVHCLNSLNNYFYYLDWLTLWFRAL